MTLDFHGNPINETERDRIAGSRSAGLWKAALQHV
jgi:hypothetical protein